MTVEVKGEGWIPCGGVEGLSVAVQWTETADSAESSSVITVTGLTITGGCPGQCTVGGTFSIGGMVLGRMEELSCRAELTEAGAAAAVAADCFPCSSLPIAHEETGGGTAVLRVQLWGSDPKERRYYASDDLLLPLTAFPKLSAVTAAGGEIGSPMDITILPVEDGVLHTLRFALGDSSGVIAEGVEGGSHTWTPPMALCAQITQSTQDICVIYCDTLREGVLLGTAECHAQLRVPGWAAIQYAEGWMVPTPYNEGTCVAGLDCFVQGLSRVYGKLNVDCIDSSKAYGAVTEAYTMTVGDVRCGAPYLSKVLYAAGDIPVSCSAVDSRGRRFMEQQLITVHPYSPPALGDVAVFRCTEDGTAAEDGSCVSVQASYQISRLGGQNTAELTARLRMAGGTYSEAVVLTADEPHVLWVGALSSAQSYEVLVEVRDVTGNVGSVAVLLATEQVFFHGRRGGSGAAFGKRAESDDLLEIAWSLKTKGDLTVEGNAVIGGRTLQSWLYPVGTVCSCDETVDPAALYGGQWALTEASLRHWIRTG